MPYHFSDMGTPQEGNCMIWKQFIYAICFPRLQICAYLGINPIELDGIYLGVDMSLALRVLFLLI